MKILIFFLAIQSSLASQCPDLKGVLTNCKIISSNIPNVFGLADHFQNFDISVLNNQKISQTQVKNLSEFQFLGLDFKEGESQKRKLDLDEKYLEPEYTAYLKSLICNGNTLKAFGKLEHSSFSFMGIEGYVETSSSQKFYYSKISKKLFGQEIFINTKCNRSR